MPNARPNGEGIQLRRPGLPQADCRIAPLDSVCCQGFALTRRPSQETLVVSTGRLKYLSSANKGLPGDRLFARSFFNRFQC